MYPLHKIKFIATHTGLFLAPITMIANSLILNEKERRKGRKKQRREKERKKVEKAESDMWYWNKIEG